ncbi:MAG: tripartite tricarboxylate transporter substrate binding protein, partial [Hyphomicrobiales bacterium]|nr:tripartite tricarboxylate transporter substrate binding protein [Hyphomicrobiales bacterium]
AAFPNIAYDPAADFAGVALFGTVPNVLIVAPSLGVKSARELVALAKTKDLTYSSAGVGSATHWAAERFRLSADFKATHVPFRGGPEATTSVMTGQVNFCCMGLSSALPFINDKMVIPLAVSTPKRSSMLPDVPTTLELGYQDSDYSFWNGALFPAKTPRAIVDKLAAEINKAIAHPDVASKLKAQGMEATPVTPQEFDALVVREIAANKALVKAAGLKFG